MNAQKTILILILGIIVGRVELCFASRMESDIARSKLAEPRVEETGDEYKAVTRMTVSDRHQEGIFESDGMLLASAGVRPGYRMTVPQQNAMPPVRTRSAQDANELKVSHERARADVDTSRLSPSLGHFYTTIPIPNPWVAFPTVIGMFGLICYLRGRFSTNAPETSYPAIDTYSKPSGLAA